MCVGARGCFFSDEVKDGSTARNDDDGQYDHERDESWKQKISVHKPTA